MFTCSKHLYIRIILFFLLLHILWLLITYKQFISQKNNDKSILMNEPYQLLIPQTCYNICQLMIKLPKTNLIHSKFIKKSQKLWPNFNANLMTLYNINNELINKGKLKNVGFIEALKLFKFNCVIFHDVNLAPINYYNSYQCDELTKYMAIHLSVGININKFKLPYKTYLGGVLKISTHHFITVNGYSNEYWGLDIENDDDFEKRLTITNIKYIHVNDRIGQYLYIPYNSKYSLQSNNLKKLLNRSNKNMNSDGLNDVSYKVISRSDLPFFTHLQVLIKQS
ncbi:unnamed protein product [Schistosoma margrebowiei]|uniref:Uncharacterized protein n=1 Tax=Schistosoma margrebowiei TaxID=48269 RepID=A0A183M378_9TREM|nr:unnamed protein product [Schistosoma margrebowiei]